MRFCSSCGTQVQGGAFCSGCGQPLGEPAATATQAAPPTVPVAGGRSRKPWVFGVLGLVLLALLVGVQTGALPRGVLDTPLVEAAVSEHFGELLDGDVSVSCPDQILQQKGRITDCTARLPSGRRATVFVEQVDSGGHFRFQAEGGALAAELRESIEREAEEVTEQIEKDTAEAIAALPRDTFVETCQDGYGAIYCGCAYDALPQSERDANLVNLLAQQPVSLPFVEAIEACGGSTD